MFISISQVSLLKNQYFIFKTESFQWERVSDYALKDYQTTHPEAKGWVVSTEFSTPLVEEFAGDDWEPGEVPVSPSSLEEFEEAVLRAFPEGEWEFTEELPFYKAVSPFLSPVLYEMGCKTGDRWEVRNSCYFYGGAMHKVRFE
jgi:hypothetical protein